MNVYWLKGCRMGNISLLSCMWMTFWCWEKSPEDRHWVKGILEQEYEKITFDEGQRITYLGMTIMKIAKGFEVSMKAYVEDILKFYGRSIHV